MTDHASSSTAKRRKIRKGTFSCWECKNRKTRCQLEPGSNTTCRFCQHRGLECVSQKFPNPVDSEIVGFEALDLPQEGLVGLPAQQRLVERPWGLLEGEFGIIKEPTRRLPSWLDAPDNTRLPLSPSLEVIPEPLSSHLQSILPDANTATLIMSRGKFFSLPIHIRRHSLQKVTSSIRSVERFAQISELPTPSTHPLHFTRKLIQLALCLQQLDSRTTERLETQLKESVHDVARRYAEIASRCVTSQDSLVLSQDGLGTLMLEACYHINVGNLSSALLLFRRALSIAQLLGLPQPGARAGSCEETAWFRLVYGDRFMSLILGLPCTISEDDFATDNPLAEDTAFEKLERIHVTVLGRIIARNVRMQRHRREGNHEGYDDYKETQDIDYSMKQAIRSLPAVWWTCPTLSSGATDEETMDSTANLLGQMHHYCYLAILHLPYVLYNVLSQSSTYNGKPSNSQVDRSYSQIAALSASREALSRFLPLRNFHRVLSYRSLDDKAYLAVIIVILSHINGHRLGRGNVLDHQRPQDLRLLNDMVICMEDISRSSKDVLSSTTLHILKKLMAIEAECADGVSHDIWLEEDVVSKQSHDLRNGREELRMKMTYFGTVCFARQRPIQPQPALSSLDSDQLEISTLSTSGIIGLTDAKNSSATSALPPLTLDSTYSPFYPTQNHESQISTFFNSASASHTPSVSMQNLSFDRAIIEEIWPLEDGDASFLQEWVDGEN